jgi:phosphotransferase system enzyme I (PtsI)
VSEVVQGISVSPGIVIGVAHVVRRQRMDVPHAAIAPRQVKRELARFESARARARERTLVLRRQVAERLGEVQAKIFDPQLLMLDDPDLVGGAITYIRESFLTAERAFSLRALEFRSQWLDASHARVMDRVADLNDVQTRVLSSLIDIPEPDLLPDSVTEPVILVAHELTPSRIVELEEGLVLGVATDGGTRTAHASILARSLGIPAVVGLGDLSRRIENGTELILDGHRGRVVIRPSDEEKRRFHDRDVQVRETARELEQLAGAAPITRDGKRIGLMVNLDMPFEVDRALAAGVDGVGLLRTEFLVVGRNEAPREEELYESFREIVQRMSPRPVTIRTFDLGGDKFPLFLPPLNEENPFLGWRGLRIYELVPDLIGRQVRAILRAAAHGPVQLLVPMVNSVEDVRRVRAVVDAAREGLEHEGVAHAACQFGVMLETPAAVSIAETLARHVDFFSLGTNDLTQYLLAVDRANAQLSPFFDPYHPALLRNVRDSVAAARRTRRPLSVCGEAASDPIGAVLLLGLGVRTLSCTPGALLEQKRLIRSLDLRTVERETARLVDAETGAEVRERVREILSKMAALPPLENDGGLSRSE